MDRYTPFLPVLDLSPAIPHNCAQIAEFGFVGPFLIRSVRQTYLSLAIEGRKDAYPPDPPRLLR